MLNSETKRHIDAARDVLVGVAPNPTTQIDQITYALIYKFMDDMDQAAVKAGGEPTFFTGALESYAWSKLVDSRMGNQEKMNLYGEALTKFSEAKQLPELFRTIFRAAFLPYRSPETLGLFLKEISYFDYSHSEELGNAYEYLLSIMSSQGDAGQFRTPRHIIDFMVDVVNPTKDDKVLDPACGTGGFLVSSYNHILEQHDGKDDPKGAERTLTPDQRKKLMQNFEGYDIDPTMGRIAQVNMYLHLFKNPKIFQYDTLTSEERWNDKFDVILANPPFMTPKGGIKPHNKFGIQAKRSEVLFVDYISSHLRPKGRAGIIVPEGIIFQSGKAYKELRKNLVESGLYVVVSLPSGVFQPYSGVKTSILFLNNEIAKNRKEILFVKIGADGFDLGASKRPIERNDLPDALKAIQAWEKGKRVDGQLVSFVSKNEIANNGDYNLSSDRYRVGVDYSKAKWPTVTLGEVITLNFGERITKKNESGDAYPVYGGGGESFRTISFNREDEVVIARFAMGENCVRFVSGKFWLMDSGGTFHVNEEFKSKVSTTYLGHLLSNMQKEIYGCARGGAQKNLHIEMFYELEIPLPPIDVQEQIVTELDGYVAIISGAKQILKNWRPKIDVDPSWPIYRIDELADLGRGRVISKNDIDANPGEYPVYSSQTTNQGTFGYLNTFDFDGEYATWTTDGANAGTVFYRNGKFNCTNVCGTIKRKAQVESVIDMRYLAQILGQVSKPYVVQVGNPKLMNQDVARITIPVPDIYLQDSLMNEIDEERAQVSVAEKLIKTYNVRTQAAIAKLWNQ